MTALTADKNYLSQKGEVQACPMEQSETIYKGSLVGMDAQGYAIPASDTASQIFRGVAIENKVADASADGTYNVRCQQTGDIQMTFTGTAGVATQADVGTEVGVMDSGSVDRLAATLHSVKVGKITSIISGTSVMVRINGYAI